MTYDNDRESLRFMVMNKRVPKECFLRVPFCKSGKRLKIDMMKIGITKYFKLYCWAYSVNVPVVGHHFEIAVKYS
jgi:hypothetical protein